MILKAVAGGANNRIRIGVLGGIGPEATAEFYSKLIKKLQCTGLIKSNKDFPQIIINSIPAPELINDNISDAELEQYVQGLKELDRAGVDFIVMVCNTIHLYHDLLQKQIKTPILDLRKEMRKFLLRNKIKSALIIGTRNTIKQGLYSYPGINIFEPTACEIKDLATAILQFNNGTDKEKQTLKIKNICRKYLRNGAKTIILGCTELAVMLGKEDIPKINTIDAMAEAVITKFIYAINKGGYNGKNN